MSNKPTASQVLGMHREGATLRLVLIEERRGSVVVRRSEAIDDVKLLDLSALGVGQQTLTAAALSTDLTLQRTIKLPVTQESKIAPLVPFQAESLLPFPAEEALLDWQLQEKKESESVVTLFAAQSKDLSNELQELEQYGCDPEGVTTEAVALAAYALEEAQSEGAHLIIHLGKDRSLVVAAIQGRVLGAHSIKEKLGSPQLRPRIQQAFLALQKSSRQPLSDKPIVTGEESDLYLAEGERLAHAESAIAYGTALSFLEGKAPPIQLRQGELSYASPFRRYQRPALLYLGLCALACLALWFTGQSWLYNREQELLQDYYSLLNSLNKTPEQVDQEVLKTKGFLPSDSAGGIKTRVIFLEEELKGQADTFPLQPNIPRVSDLLAWLTTLPEVVKEGEELIRIDSLNYTMSKRPEATNKRQRYQVRVDLEFSTDTPRHARELRDAFTTPNLFIDGSSDVKWSSTQGKYKATFFLKDRTAYFSALLNRSPLYVA